MVNRSFDFSRNGDFLVSVSLGVVVWWLTAKFLGINTNLKPTLTMDFKHHTEMICNTTTSPADDDKIISNGSKEIAVHDVHT